MGRPKILDRDFLLECAAGIVATGGIGALSLDGVAKAAGVSKGGIQSTFGTKAQLIGELFDRCQQKTGSRLAAVADNSEPSTDLPSIYFEILSQIEASSGEVAIAIFSAMAKSPEYRQTLQKRYTDRLATMRTFEKAEGSMRLAFMAMHGAFLLRHLGFMEIDREEWAQILKDVQNLSKGVFNK